MPKNQGFLGPAVSELISPKNVLVTGGRGYLGTHIVRDLLAAEWEVDVLSRSEKSLTVFDKVKVQTAGSVASLPKSYDLVLHLACCYGRNGETEKEIFSANLEAPMDTFSHMDLSSSCFINFGSALPPETSPYAKSKQEFWKAAKSDLSFKRAFEIQLEQFFGPGDNSILSRVLASLKRGESLPLTAGEQRRDFLYYKDVLTAVKTLILHREQLEMGESIPLGSGQAITLREMLTKLGDFIGASSQLEFGALGYRKNEPMESRANISRMNSLGWSPQWDLDSALIEFVKESGVSQ